MGDKKWKPLVRDLLLAAFCFWGNCCMLPKN